MALSIQQMREKRSEDARALRNLVDNHPGASWGADQQAKFDNLSAEIDRTDGEIARNQRALDVDAQNAHRENVDRVADKLGTTISNAQDVVQAEREIFGAFLRGGIHAATAKRDAFAEKGLRIQNTMSTTTTTEGGYLVPTGFSGQIVDSMKAYGGVREVATVISTAAGNNINWPTSDATSEVGEILAQNATATDDDFAFGVKTIGAYKYSSKVVPVPLELLQDAQVNLEQWIAGRLGVRLGRITNTHFTTGTGTNQPEGVMTAATLGKTGTTGQTTSVIYDDLVDLQHAVDPAYRAGARYMMRDSTLAVIKKLKDSQNRPLWLPGVATKEPDTILGYGYTINQDVATMAASARSIAFGDLSKYLVRDSMSVELFRFTDSAYMKSGQVAFLAFLRTDGKLLDTAAVKYYANSAT